MDFCDTATSIKWLKACLFWWRKKNWAFTLKLGMKNATQRPSHSNNLRIVMFYVQQVKWLSGAGCKICIKYSNSYKMHKDYNSLGNTVCNLGLKVLELNKDTSVCKLLNLLRITFVEKMSPFFFFSPKPRGSSSGLASIDFWGEGIWECGCISPSDTFV